MRNLPRLDIVKNSTKNGTTYTMTVCAQEFLKEYLEEALRKDIENKAGFLGLGRRRQNERQV